MAKFLSSKFWLGDCVVDKLFVILRMIVKFGNLNNFFVTHKIQRCSIDCLEVP